MHNEKTFIFSSLCRRIGKLNCGTLLYVLRFNETEEIADLAASLNNSSDKDITEIEAKLNSRL